MFIDGLAGNGKVFRSDTFGTNDWLIVESDTIIWPTRLVSNFSKT